MPSVIGVDGGGSRCAAWWIDHEGHVLGHGVGGTTHEWYGTGDRVVESIESAVSAMLAEGRRPDLGAFTSPGGSLAFERFREMLAPAKALPCGESHVQFAAARREHGIMVLAGTGSHVAVRAPDGRRLTVGGAGPVIGDQGSGHEIGLLAITQACLAQLAPSVRTPLSEAVKAHFGVEDRWDLVTLFHEYNPGRRAIAALAPLVCEHAEKGDRAALGILDEAARRLAGLVALAVDELGLEEGEGEILFAGGTTSSPAYREALARRIAPIFRLGARFETVIYPPGVGAALIGLRHLGVVLDEAAYERLGHEVASARARTREGSS